MVNLDEILQALSHERPIFHSEADFQHAVAWRIHEVVPSARIRLEYRPMANERIYLDALVSSPSGALAIELKYLTRLLAIDMAGEPIRLANQGAQDIRSYDFVKDISRLERVVTMHPMTRGAAILLTNDRSYWSEPTKIGGVHAAFRLYEGRRLAGRLDWASHTGPGTKKKREESLVLREAYQLRWRDYSDLGVSAGRFRYLLVPVE